MLRHCFLQYYEKICMHVGFCDVKNFISYVIKLIINKNEVFLKNVNASKYTSV